MHAVYMHRTWLSFALIVPLNVGGFSLSPVPDRNKHLTRQYGVIRQHSRCWATHAPTDLSISDWVLTSRLGVPEGFPQDPPSRNMCLALTERTSEGVGAGKPDMIVHNLIEHLRAVPDIAILLRMKR